MNHKRFPTLILPCLAIVCTTIVSHTLKAENATLNEPQAEVTQNIGVPVPTEGQAEPTVSASQSVPLEDQAESTPSTSTPAPLEEQNNSAQSNVAEQANTHQEQDTTTQNTQATAPGETQSAPPPPNNEPEQTNLTQAEHPPTAASDVQTDTAESAELSPLEENPFASPSTSTENHSPYYSYWRDRAQYVRERNDARRKAMQERSRAMREWVENQRPDTGSEQIRQAMENRLQWQRNNAEAWRRWINPRGAYMSDWSKARQLYFDKLAEQRMKYFNSLINSHPWGPYGYSR